MRGLLAAGCLCVACATTAACGGGSLALDPVARAADHTESAGSAKVTLAMKLTRGGSTQTIDGSGFTNFDSGDAHVVMNLPGGKGQLEEVMKDGILYLKVPDAGLPGGKSWAKIDPKELAKAAGLKLPDGSGQNPGQALDSLNGAADEQTIGKETIDGVDTTHYRTTVDLQKVAQKAKPWFKQAAAGAGPKTETMDVWVDGSSLVRRMEMQLGSDADLTMDFSDFGTTFAVDAPPADDTVDAVKLIEQQQGP